MSEERFGFCGDRAIRKETAMTHGNERIFIDTSSCLLDASASVLEDKLLPAAAQNGWSVVLPLRVYQELNKHAGGDRAQLRALATRALTVIEYGRRAGIVNLVGSDQDQYADAMFQTAFAQFRTKFPLVLITQDVALMADILGLADPRSVSRGIYPIAVWTIDEQAGVLRTVHIDEAERRYAAQQDRKKRMGVGNERASSFEPYATVDTPVTTVTPIDVDSADPVEGAALTDSNGGSVRLGRRLARGGEGTVYLTERPGIVAKIYARNRLTVERRDKLARMVEHGLDWSNPLSKGICWPTALLTDGNGVFRGYLMPQAQGEILQSAVFVGTQLKARFPKWDRIDLVDLCLMIVQKINFLHESNILIGDINPFNIMITESKEVYFLDTDSFQIEQWPCPVGSDRFTAPELQGETFGSLFRTPEHERFAVAMLLFMILHAGKSPYAQKGAENPRSNIRARRFQYAFRDGGAQNYANAPEGPWKYLWSNLTYKMKEAFHQSFDASQADKRRIKLTAWFARLEAYRYHLANHVVAGEIERQLLPTSYKPLSDHALETFHR